MAAPMKIGFACPCCRKKGTRERSEASAELLASLEMCGSCEDAGVSPPDLSIYTLPLATGICALDASEAFQGLTVVERLYAFGLGKADWEGAKICLVQCSPESVPIFSLLQLVFSAQPVVELVAAAGARGLDQTELDQAMMYAAAIYGNLGNYKSFGDTKIVPQLPADRMELFLTAGRADPAKVGGLWGECGDRMYALPPRARQMGLGREKGTSTYFSSNCEQADADLAGRFMESLQLSPYNTRLFKDSSGGQYTVLLASAVRDGGDDAIGQLCRAHDFEGKTFVVQRGDHAPLMARVVDGLRQALPHVANEKQKVMLERYIESFELGSVAAHVEASKHWIGDTGPAVESYIGFIESYRDPSGARGEWEGFVACVNREVSKKFQALVDQAENLLKKFPWPPAFEKDVFMRPDFTSLDVLAFGCSGVPAGINIPNYDDVRQTTGFKNVSLGNVLAASYGTASAKPISFLGAGDQELYKTLQPAAFEVQVGIHELLGHGSGKVFMSEEAERLKDIEDPLTGAKVAGPFYAPGATWDTVFGTIASSYEECRAECSGLYLCVEPEVLAVFGHDGGAGGIVDVAYVNWLHMARAGLMGLEFYTPEVSKWRQAHMQGRYVILRVLLEAGQDFVTLRQTEGADGKPDLEVVLDRSKIMSVGHPAIGNFLLKLQVHKSLGDFAAGSALYARYSEVPDDMLGLRAVVMARKEPRKLMVQPHMRLAEGGSDVELCNFPASTAGLVESFVARFPAEDAELLALYEAEKAQHDGYVAV